MKQTLPPSERSLTGFFIQNKEHQRFWFDFERIRFISVVPTAVFPDPSLEFLEQTAKSVVVKEVIDSCNGLLLCSINTCKSNVKTYFVCNPCTEEKVAVPDHPGKSSDSNIFYYALMADLKQNFLKFKILCLVRPQDSDSDSYSELSIFSSDDCGWTALDVNLPPVSHEFLKGSKVFFNGSLYWDCLEGHILVCHLNVVQQSPSSYRLIEAPQAPLGRCLWKSEDKLHCYCHGFGDEFPDWTLDEHGLQWKLEEDCKQFRNLTDDVAEFFANQQWLIGRKTKHQRIQFKIISYAPESNTFFLFIRYHVYTYSASERQMEYLGGTTNSGFGRRLLFQAQCCVLPYVRSFEPIKSCLTE